MSRDQSAKRNKGAAQLATTEKLQRNMWFSPLCQVMLNPNQLKYFKMIRKSLEDFPFGCKKSDNPNRAKR